MARAGGGPSFWWEMFCGFVKWWGVMFLEFVNGGLGRWGGRGQG